MPSENAEALRRLYEQVLADAVTRTAHGETITASDLVHLLDAHARIENIEDIERANERTRKPSQPPADDLAAAFSLDLDEPEL